MDTLASTHSSTITKEIRFAVVMYGGISLAIYMNGIAQELLALVKATADSSGNKELKGSEKVYKEIADYLTEITPAFNHKFVVDIISGTSAGGINGVCLAKGLVRGLDDLKVLERIWLNEGNIDTLLNDSNSQPRLYPSKEPKTSLFNSQRMYAKLLGAFKEMEKGVKAEPNPHIYSMDLFVTATDLRGLQVPIQLSDSTANEHIHKHVFPFKYREDESLRDKPLNHFLGDFDPMLAFASRCTSSIPPAFEPVKIREILDYLQEHEPKDYENVAKHFDEWGASFFQTYFLLNGNENDGISLKEREFADGGYLDNRPFGHAINAIHERQADCPIDRKLLFIDPSPEDKDIKERTKEISFVQNSVLAFTLPRYETIREELKALQKRNEWINKVHHILEEKLVDNNREHLKQRIVNSESYEFIISSQINSTGNIAEKLFSIPLVAIQQSEPLASQQTVTPEEILVKKFWKEIANPKKENSKYDTEVKDFNSMFKLLGGAYPAYHYTRMNLLTDQLALIIARAGLVDENSEIFQTIRNNLKEWRTTHYNAFKRGISDFGEMKTENMFFREFDIDFRIRRLSYFRKILEKAISENNVAYLCFGMVNDEPGTQNPETISCKKWNNDFSTAINIFYNELCKNLKSYYLLKEQLFCYGDENPLYKKLNEGVVSDSKEPHKFSHEKIKSFFSQQYNSGSELDDFKKDFDTLMDALHDFIADFDQNHQHGTTQASELLSNSFSKLSENYPEIAGRLRFMYDYGYDLYDATTFQLLAGGDYGEGNVVDILRISPADAPSLWNESEKKKSKLAGTALGAFGGFLDREWRRNDIMWGRLDAAERIITALLPDALSAQSKEKKAAFIEKVQEIILREALNEWIAELASTQFTVSKDEEQYIRLLSIQKSFDSSGVQGNGKGEPAWKQQFKNAYDFHRELEPEPTLRRLGRGSGILSSMVDRLDPGKGIIEKISGYLKKLNWILLSMLDFSTPKTMKGVLLGYWLQLLVLVSVILIAMGIFLNTYAAKSGIGDPVRNLGLLLLCIDIIVMLIKKSLLTHIHRIKNRQATMRD